MNFTSIKRGFCTFMQIAKHYSPEAAVISGVVIGGIAIGKAIHDTLKSEEIITGYCERKDELNECRERLEAGKEVIYINPETKEEKKITLEDVKHDTRILNVKTVFKLANHYKFTIGLAALSAVLTLCGFGSMRKRAVAAVGALGAANEAFKKYRNRVTEKFGIDIDREMLTGLKKVDKDKMADVTDPDGEVRKDIGEHWVDHNDYCMLFHKDASNYWRNNRNMNIGWLKGIERQATIKLRSQGYLFLNDVLRALGMPETEMGCFCGWLHNSADGDNFVDFGIGDEHASYIYGDDIYDVDPDVFLYFNCVGDISRRFAKFSHRN